MARAIKHGLIFRYISSNHNAFSAVLCELTSCTYRFPVIAVIYDFHMPMLHDNTLTCIHKPLSLPWLSDLVAYQKCPFVLYENVQPIVGLRTVNVICCDILSYGLCQFSFILIWYLDVSQTRLAWIMLTRSC